MHFGCFLSNLVASYLLIHMHHTWRMSAAGEPLTDGQIHGYESSFSWSSVWESFAVQQKQLSCCFHSMKILSKVLHPPLVWGSEPVSRGEGVYLTHLGANHPRPLVADVLQCCGDVDLFHTRKTSQEKHFVYFPLSCRYCLFKYLFRHRQQRVTHISKAHL